MTVVSATVTTATLVITALPAPVKTDAAARLVDLLSQSGATPDQTQALKDQQAKLQGLLQQMQSSSQTLAQQRKDAAQQRIAFIKAEIDALMKMGALGDPRSIAQEASRLSKDLASAVIDYTAATSDSRAAVAGTDAAAPPAQMAQEDAAFKTEVNDLVNKLKNIVALQKLRALDSSVGKGIDAVFSLISKTLDALTASESGDSASGVLNIFT